MRYYSDDELGVEPVYKEATEDIEIGPGRNVFGLLPEYLRRSLSEPGGESHGGDFSRQDAGVITAILSAGYSPGDAYTTFASSRRGKDAEHRKEGHVVDYIQRTIRSAYSYLNTDNKIKVDFSKKRIEGKDNGLQIQWTKDVEIEQVRWVWYPFLPAGKMTVLAGDPGMGKSTLGLDLVARISRGTYMPTGNRTISGSCLVASAEDAPEDTISPRIIAAGGNLNKIGIIRQVRIEDETRYLCFPRDLEVLHDSISRKGIRLLIIDPLNAFLEKGTDTYKDQDVRAVLAPLENMAEETGVSILIIAHLNKKEDANTLYRVGGSIGFIGAARSVLGVTRTPENKRVLYSLKSNLAKRPEALLYDMTQIRRTRKEDTDWKGEEKVTSSKIKWMGSTNFDPMSSLARDQQEVLKEGSIFFKAVLGEGEIESEIVFQQAKQAGIQRSELSYMRRSLGVQIFKKKDSWFWKLPE